MWKFTNKYVSNNTHGKISKFSRNKFHWMWMIDFCWTKREIGLVTILKDIVAIETLLLRKSFLTKTYKLIKLHHVKTMLFSKTKQTKNSASTSFSAVTWRRISVIFLRLLSTGRRPLLFVDFFKLCCL